MTYHIYKILNLVNGKAYIGFTSKAPEKRLAEHCRDALAKRDLKKRPSGRLLYNAIRQYGSEAFVVEVLFSSTDKDKTKNEMESRFIKEENSHYIAGYGYNMTFGGDGGATLSAAAYLERSKSMIGTGNPMYGTQQSQSTKDKIRLSRIGKPSPMKGKHFSLDVRENMRQAHIGKQHSDVTKQKMSASHKGKSVLHRRPPSEDSKLKRKATWAAKTILSVDTIPKIDML
jgi:group I intron endonuclease